jgi:drug/metabolite transporter (DMT)-like permease
MFVGIVLFILFFQDPLPKTNLFLVVLLLVMIFISLYQNIFEAKGIKLKELSFRESITGIEPIIAGSLAFLIFPSEREIKYLVGIILGGLILYFGNRKKKHKFSLDKGTLYLFLAISFAAILSNIYKFGLETISPNFIFFFRIGGVLLFLIFFKHANRIKDVESKGKKMALLSGIFYLAGSLANLYSIQKLGLNLTILIMMLGPALIYVFSFTLLKEKFQLKRIIMSILLLSLVLIITYI